MRNVSRAMRNVSLLACLFGVALFLAIGYVAPPAVEAQQRSWLRTVDSPPLAAKDSSRSRRARLTSI